MDTEMSDKEVGRLITSGCMGLATMFTIMGFCGYTFGFWGGVTGLGLGLVSFLIVAEVSARILIWLDP